MERLNGMDASFLYMETPTSHMHVTGVIVVDPSTADGEYGYERVLHLLESRMHLMPQFRRRVMSVPFGIDHPVWIEDPGFDVANHVHRTTLRPPGSRHELADLVSDIAGRPLDRGRPLWEMWVAEGGEDGTVALVSKMHHCAIDGITGADLMSSLFDLEPDAPEPDPPEEEWVPDEVPTDTQLATDAMIGRAMDPAKNVRAALRTGHAGRRRRFVRQPQRRRAQPGAAVHRPERPVDQVDLASAGGGVRASGAGRPEGHQGGLRVQDQRRRAGRLHAGAAPVPARPWRRARPAAHLDGAGVRARPGRRHQRHQPGVEHGGTAPGPSGRPCRPAPRDQRGHQGGQGDAERHRRRHAARLHPVHAAGAVQPGHAPVLAERPGGPPPADPEPGDLQRAGPPHPALHGRGPGCRRVPVRAAHRKARE